MPLPLDKLIRIKNLHSKTNYIPGVGKTEEYKGIRSGGSHHIFLYILSLVPVEKNRLILRRIQPSCNLVVCTQLPCQMRYLLLKEVTMASDTIDLVNVCFLIPV